MGQPIAIAEAIAFAFPDICLTPTPGGPVPIPYPNIAQLAQAEQTSATGGDPVFAGGKPVLTAESFVRISSGDEAGTAGGVASGRNMGPCTFATASTTVFIHGQGVVRFGDQTEQNKTSVASGANALGTVLSAFPTVLVGG
jgi:hypothetical protein